MKNLLITSFFILITGFTTNCAAQDTGTKATDIFRRIYNAELTYETSKQFVFTELIKVPHDKLAGVLLYPVSTSKYGELTTLVYHSEDLDRKGFIFAFWDEYVTASNMSYNGYSFRAFEITDETENLLTRLKEIIEDKKGALKDDNNAIYQYEDVTFGFYKEGMKKSIDVFWNGYKSKWNDANLKKTIKRVQKVMKKKGK